MELGTLSFEYIHVCKLRVYVQLKGVFTLTI